MHTKNSRISVLKCRRIWNEKESNGIIDSARVGMRISYRMHRAYKVSNNISQEADNFNVTRKLTVLNARTDTILLELTGTFSVQNNSENELEVIIETAEGKYQKDLVYLNDYTMYVVEDISGADVDKYHYEINFLPEWGVKVTHED